MMIKVGILLMIDKRFRTEALCRTCHQPIGNEDFCIAVQPQLPNSVDVEYYEHIECKAKAERDFQEWKAKNE